MSKQFNYTLGIIWISAIFVLPLPFLWTYSIGLSGIHLMDKLSVSYGIIAYIWMLFAIYLGTKPKWVDRLIGLPSAYFLHGVLSLVAIVLAFLHKGNLHSEGLVALTGNVAFNLFVGLAVYSLIFMAGWLSSRIPFLAKIKNALETIFKHELSIWIHRLNIVATLLIFLHIQLIDYVRANTTFMLAIYVTTIFVFGKYLWTKLQPNAVGIKAKLVSNHEIGENIFELRIQLPKSSKQTYRPGDYAFISFPQIKGLEEPHPFSLVNAPGHHNELVLAIRGDGDFTRQIQAVKAPCSVYVDGGYGQYQAVIDERKPQEILAIAGGIGITPILSVVEAYPQIKTNLFHNGHTEVSLIYKEKFERWESRSNFQGYQQVGRFSEEAILSQLPDKLDGVLVLLSGPPAMARKWQKVLVKQGLTRQQIFYEEFGW